MTYAPSIGGRVWSLIGGLLLTVVLSVAIPKLAIEGILEIRTQSVLVGALTVILVLGVALTVRHVFITGPVTVRTTPTHVTVHRGGRERENWARETTAFSSFIIRESTNGIPTGVTRKLIAVTSGERVETVLRWFSAKTYNSLIADVAPLVPVTHSAAAPSLAAPMPVVSTGTFTLDNARATRARTIGLVVLAVGLLAAAAFIGVGIEDFGAAVIIIGSALVLVVIVAAALLLRGRGIPKQVTVSPSALTFDDRVFPLGQLSSIVATPATYENARGRVITLVSTTGSRTRIPLGNIGSKNFPDYGSYLDTIRGATTHRPGMFTLDVA